MKPNPMLDHIARRLRGEPTTPPPERPLTRDQAMSKFVSDKLKGQSPADYIDGKDTRPDTTPAGDTSSDTTDNGTPEDEARAQLAALDGGDEILTALADPSDELHAVAKRLLAAFSEMVRLERKKAAQP